MLWNQLDLNVDHKHIESSIIYQVTMSSELSPSDRELFISFGLDGALKQISSNASLGTALKDCITATALTSCDTRTGNLLFTIAGSIPESRASRRRQLSVIVASGALRTSAQVSAAVDYVKKSAPAADDKPLEADDAFAKACGLGVVVSDADLARAAAAIMENAGEVLVRDRYAFPIFSLLPAMKEGALKWADGKASKDAFDAAVLAKLGPRTAEDDVKVAEAKKAGSGGGKGAGKGKDAAASAAAPAQSAGAAASAAAATSSASSDASAAAGINNPFAARDVEAARNSPALLAEHAAIVGKGVVRTRFPPEPNGFLHIGHAKSMLLNFELAFKLLGVQPGAGDTTFRYDDTNPDAESQEYIDNQAENVAWMGWKPARTTHSSDYFGALFAYAQRLIREGHAYVCHQTKADIEASREAARKNGRATDSPWRDRPAAESLALFDAMRAGRFEEGAATLRMKIDMGSPNPTLWDPVAYRVKFTPHPHTGNDWCIYPSYDYSHAIIDSIEHIDYSLW